MSRRLATCHVVPSYGENHSPETTRQPLAFTGLDVSGLNACLFCSFRDPFVYQKELLSQSHRMQLMSLCSISPNGPGYPAFARFPRLQHVVVSHDDALRALA